MSGMLARLAALRARKQAAPAASPATPAVHAALAAAAAAAGTPTKGTWDKDYAERLRDVGGGESSGSEEEEGEMVVLPPPAVKLDPVAAREKWRREIRAAARKGMVVEEIKEEVAEVKEEFVEVEVVGEIEDEDDLLDGGGEDEEEGDEEGEEGDVGSEADDSDSADGKMERRVGEEEEEEDLDEDEDEDIPAPVLAAAGDGKKNTSIFDFHSTASSKKESASSAQPTSVPKPTASPSGKTSPSIAGSLSPSPSPSPSSSPLPSPSPPRERLVLVTDRPGPSTRPAFVDDQADDEDDGVGRGGDRDSDRDSDVDEATEADALVADDDTSPGGVDSSAVAFHRKWQERDEADRMEAIVAGAQGFRGRVAATGRPRDDDNAMDLSELVRSGAVEAGAAGSECGDMNGGDEDIVGDGGESSDDFPLKSDMNNYVEDMFRLNREESGFIDIEEEGSDDSPAKRAEEERRSKAMALWRARQKAKVLSTSALDSVDLSRCEFLKDDEERRDHYRSQIERAQGVTASRDGWSLAGAAIRPTESASLAGPRGDSKNVLEGIRPAAGASRTSRFPPLQVGGKKVASRSGFLDPDVIPEQERRKLCLGRKEAHRRCGTSIGRWGFSAERSMGSRTEDERVAVVKGTSKASGGMVSVRRKRVRNQEAALPAAAASSANAQSLPRKKPKRSRQGLLDILGSRPQA